MTSVLFSGLHCRCVCSLKIEDAPSVDPLSSFEVSFLMQNKLNSLSIRFLYSGMQLNFPKMKLDSTKMESVRKSVLWGVTKVSKTLMTKYGRLSTEG